MLFPRTKQNNWKRKEFFLYHPINIHSIKRRTVFFFSIHIHSPQPTPSVSGFLSITPQQRLLLINMHFRDTTDNDAPTPSITSCKTDDNLLNGDEFIRKTCKKLVSKYPPISRNLQGAVTFLKSLEEQTECPHEVFRLICSFLSDHVEYLEASSDERMKVWMSYFEASKEAYTTFALMVKHYDPIYDSGVFRFPSIHKKKRCVGGSFHSSALSVSNVSTLLDPNPFDADSMAETLFQKGKTNANSRQWSSKEEILASWDESRMNGVMMHRFIECFFAKGTHIRMNFRNPFNGVPGVLVDQFLDFYKARHQTFGIPFRTEMPVYFTAPSEMNYPPDERLDISGTVDFVGYESSSFYAKTITKLRSVTSGAPKLVDNCIHCRDNASKGAKRVLFSDAFQEQKPDIIVADWKVSKNFTKDFIQPGQLFKPPFHEIATTKRNRYAIQVNVYMFMLREMGYTVRNGFIVCMHSSQKTYVCESVNDYSEEVEEFMNNPRKYLDAETVEQLLEKKRSAKVSSVQFVDCVETLKKHFFSNF